MAWVQNFLELVVRAIEEHEIPVGHLKFLLSDGVRHQKLSLVSGDSEPVFKVNQTEEWGRTIELTINARLECKREEIQQLFQQCLAKNTDTEKTKMTLIAEEAFHPRYPSPTYRFPKIG